MWQDAMRVCKEYSPHKLQELQDEYEREVLTKRGGAGAGGLGTCCLLNSFSFSALLSDLFTTELLSLYIYLHSYSYS